MNNPKWLKLPLDEQQQNSETSNHEFATHRALSNESDTTSNEPTEREYRTSSGFETSSNEQESAVENAQCTPTDSQEVSKVDLQQSSQKGNPQRILKTHRPQKTPGSSINQPAKWGPWGFATEEYLKTYQAKLSHLNHLEELRKQKESETIPSYQEGAWGIRPKALDECTQKTAKPPRPPSIPKKSAIPSGQWGTWGSMRK